ncbi:MAG: MmgE/PrpD family protein [Alphaproteobacteria bacterium]|nr:MmgE/PrpD family protein [Alphaproteobacteria bacterium]
MSATPSLTGLLAERLARAVDPATRARARLHLLDWLACVAGARGSAVADAAKRGEPDPVLRAALGGNLLEMDDVDRQGRLHPGPAIWPAALLAARDRGAEVGALLDAGVRGYEATIAVGRTFDDRHYGFWHNTATAGGFGAAVAAASLHGVGADGYVAALGNAGSVAGGLWRMRHEPVMTKALHVAHVARTGAWIGALAAAGVTGPHQILEGAQGLFAATTDAPRLAGFPGGGAWRIGEISFKPYPACRHAHPTIDAALALRDALSEGPIRVETYRDALIFCDRAEPTTAIEAKFSLQHCVAVVAVKGVPALADFEPAGIADPAVAAVRARVTVAEGADLNAAYPAHFGARITAGGRTFTAEDALGDPERPVGEADLVAKLRELVAWGGLATSEADAAEALVLRGGDDAPVVPLIDLLTRWTA